jgi:hypothetical protein
MFEDCTGTLDEGRGMVETIGAFAYACTISAAEIFICRTGFIGGGGVSCCVGGGAMADAGFGPFVRTCWISCIWGMTMLKE